MMMQGGPVGAYQTTQMVNTGYMAQPTVGYQTMQVQAPMQMQQMQYRPAVQQVTTQAAPVQYTQAAPVQYIQRPAVQQVTTQAAPVQYAAPQMMMAQPRMVTAAAPQTVQYMSAPSQQIVTGGQYMSSGVVGGGLIGGGYMGGGLVSGGLVGGGVVGGGIVSSGVVGGGMYGSQVMPLGVQSAGDPFAGLTPGQALSAQQCAMLNLPQGAVFNGVSNGAVEQQYQAQDYDQQYQQAYGQEYSQTGAAGNQAQYSYEQTSYTQEYSSNSYQGGSNDQMSGTQV